MNFLNLEYFLAVAKELNITKAANELNVSQQALSKHILNLEREMNLILFERNKQLELTEAGSCFVTYAKQTLALKSQMLTQMSDIIERKDSNIRIGITQARSSVYLPHLLSRFCRTFPEAKVHLTEDASDVLFDNLQDDKLDLVIGIEPHDRVNFISTPLCIEDYAIMVIPEVLHRCLSPEEIQELQTRPKEVTIETFRKCPFVCFDRTLRIGRIFQDSCKEIGFKPDIIIESKSMNTLIYLCALGLGVTVCPRVYLEIAKRQSNIFRAIQVFPVTNMPMTTKIVLTIQRDRYTSHLVREFIRIANEEFQFSQNQLHTGTEIYARRSDSEKTHGKQKNIRF